MIACRATVWRTGTGAHPPGVRLRRSDVHGPGWRRRRAGRGFAYYDEDGVLIKDERLDRVRALAIPPAWKDVWICPWPNGHIQATGVDAAGRRQYRYHDQWRARRDAEKHERVLEIASQLPDVRDAVVDALHTRGLNRERVLACAIRLLDLGAFRVGSEQYAEDNGTYGLATLRREHVSVRGERTFFSYTAKGGMEREVEITDRPTATVVREPAGAAGGHGGGAAGLPAGRRHLAGRHQQRDQRLPQGDQRRGDHRQGLPDLDGDRAHGRPAGRGAAADGRGPAARR